MSTVSPSRSILNSRAIDMNQKREDYERAGVLEYLVLCVEERQLHWFHFPSRRMIRPDRQGIARSRAFPGLWIDAPALLNRDARRLQAAVGAGLASPAHATFVKRLERARKRRWTEKRGRAHLSHGGKLMAKCARPVF